METSRVREQKIEIDKNLSSAQDQKRGNLEFKTEKIEQLQKQERFVFQYNWQQICELCLLYAKIVES